MEKREKEGKAKREQALSQSPQPTGILKAMMANASIYLFYFFIFVSSKDS